MTLIDDLLTLGLPAAEENGEIVFSRLLNRAERMTYSALIIKYMPEPEKSQALEKRRDIGNLLTEIEARLTAEPNRLDLRQEYINAVDKLATISTATTMTSAEAIAAIRYIAKILLFLLRYLVKRYQIAE